MLHLYVILMTKLRVMYSFLFPFRFAESRFVVRPSRHRSDQAFHFFRPCVINDVIEINNTTSILS